MIVAFNYVFVVNELLTRNDTRMMTPRISGWPDRYVSGVWLAPKVAREGFLVQTRASAGRVSGGSLIRGASICNKEKNKSVIEKTVAQAGGSLVRGSLVRGFTVFVIQLNGTAVNVTSVAK